MRKRNSNHTVGFSGTGVLSDDAKGLLIESPRSFLEPNIPHAYEKKTSKFFFPRREMVGVTFSHALVKEDGHWYALSGEKNIAGNPIATYLLDTNDATITYSPREVTTLAPNAKKKPIGFDLKINFVIAILKKLESKMPHSVLTPENISYTPRENNKIEVDFQVPLESKVDDADQKEFVHRSLINILDQFFSEGEFVLTERSLVSDIRHLIADLKKRESFLTIELIRKFFYAIPKRVSQYLDYQGLNPLLLDKFKELLGVYNMVSSSQLVLNDDVGEMIRQVKNNEINKLFPPSFFAEVEQLLQPPETHYEVIKKTIKTELPQSFFPTDQFSEKMDGVIEALKKLKINLNSTGVQLGSDKFNGTNSDGIKKMQDVMNSGLSWHGKLLALRKIGLEKHPKTISNQLKRWRCSLLGMQGRHPNIDLLYQKCAELKEEMTIDEKGADISHNAQIEDINGHIVNNKKFTW